MDDRESTDQQQQQQGRTNKEAPLSPGPTLRLKRETPKYMYSQRQDPEEGNPPR